MRWWVRAAVAVLAVVLVGAPWMLWWRTHEELRALRATQALGPTIREVVRELQPGETRVITLPLPGGAGPSPARVEIVTVPVPGQDRVREVQRVVTVTPPVPCRTEEECRRIFGSSQQAILVNARLPRDTVVPVRVTIDGTVQEVQAPLSRDFDVVLRLVQAEPGVWHALQTETEPLRVTEVRTETTAPAREMQQVEPPGHADHLRAVFSVATDAIRAGLEYENWWGPGRYRIQVGVQTGSTGGWYATASYVLPLR